MATKRIAFSVMLHTEPMRRIDLIEEEYDYQFTLGRIVFDIRMDLYIVFR